MGYKISDNVFVRKDRTDENFIFFNNKTLELLKGTEEDNKLLQEVEFSGLDKNNSTVQEFIERGFIVVDGETARKNSCDNRDKLRHKFKKRKSNIGYMRISLTEKCNLRCKYCFVNEIFDVKREMTEESFVEIFNWFINQNSGGIPTVQYFGGEPLLKMNLVKLGHEMLEKAKLKGEILDYSEEIVTNGTLMTNDKARYFVEKGLDIIFSIDGWKEINDKNRVYSDGRGSFEDLLNGMRIYSLEGGELSALITPSSENVEFIDQIVDYLISELAFKRIGINSPQPNANGWELQGEILARSIQKSWEIAEKCKVELNAPGNNLMYLLNTKQPQVFSCMSVSRTDDSNSWGIFVSSSGDISKCVVECDKRCTTSFEDFKLDCDFNDWHFQVNSSNHCEKCIAYMVCSGACSVEKLLAGKNTITEKCKFNKSMVEWIITK